MKDLPLKKLRNFGGKLGAELGEMQCSDCRPGGHCCICMPISVNEMS